jgi:dUTP pyrophosphatase
MTTVQIPIKTLPHGAGLPLPTYATPMSAGMDLYAAVTSSAVLMPGERLLVPTGMSMALPLGYEAQIRPRSGLARKHGITVLNSPGTIDTDYRGEVQVLLVHLGTEVYMVQRGDRIAQFVVTPCVQGIWVPQDDLETTQRASGGFGSTGVSNYS